MRIILILAMCLGLSACVGSTTKITYINVSQESQTESTIDFADTTVDTDTDQAADGSADADLAGL